MAELHTFSGSSPELGERSPHLIVVPEDLTGSFFEPEQRLAPPLHEELLRESIDQTLADQQTWPSYTFEFSESNVVGISSMTTSAVTRAASGIRSIRRVAPESLEPAKKPITEDILRDMQKFMDKAAGPYEGLTYKPRKNILPPKLAISALATQLRSHNDPVIQAHDQITREFAGRVEEPDLARLLQDMILTAKHQTVRDIYSTYITDLQHAGNALLHFMTQS